MSKAFNSGPELLQPTGEAFNTPSQLQDLRESHDSLSDLVSKHGAVLAEHQGNIKGIFPAVSAVQSSLGAWLSVVGVITAMIVGLLIFGLTRVNVVGDRVDQQSQRMGGVEVRLGGVEAKISGIDDRLAILPQRIAAELRAQAEATPSVASQGTRKR